MKTFPGEPLLELKFRKSPTLVLTEIFVFPCEHAEGAVLRVDSHYKWRTGVMAFAVCLLSYRLRDLRGHTPGKFIFEGARQESPAASLGDLLGKLPDWLLQPRKRPLHQILTNIFNSSGKSEGTRKIGINQDSLPARQIKVSLDGREQSTALQLGELANAILQEGGWETPGSLAEEIPEPRLENWLPFTRVTDGFPLFGLGKTRADRITAPSREELLGPAFSAPPVWPEVEQRIESNGWCLLMGPPCSGKTTLAAYAATQLQREGWEICYLRLASSGSSQNPSEILRTAQCLSARKVLVVVDDFHEDEWTARLLLNLWLDQSPRARLLLVGLPVGALEHQPASPLEEFAHQGITLRSSPQLLGNIFNWLVQHLAPQRQVGLPTSEELVEWHNLFGLDLLAFSIAVRHRLHAIVRNDLRLSPKDVREHVWNQYLLKASAPQRHNLLTLAAFARAGTTVPRSSLDSRGIDGLEDTGLVVSSLHGQGHHARYSLIHAGFGELLLAAAPEPVSEADLNEMACRHEPFLATAEAARWERQERVPQARQLLELALETPNATSRLLEAGLQYAVVIFKRYSRLGVLTKDEVDNLLVEHGEDVLRESLRAPPPFLITLFQQSRHDWPRLHANLCRRLAQPANALSLLNNLLTSPADDVAHFLQYTEDELPGYCSEIWFRMLTEPRLVSRLEACLLTGNASSLLRFCAFAEECLPPAISSMVEGIIASPHFEHTIRKLLSGAAIASLVSFLVYLKKCGSDGPLLLARNLLKEKELRSLLEERLLNATVDNQLRFLEDCGEFLTAALRRSLLETVRKEILASGAVERVPLEHWPRVAEMVRTYFPQPKARELFNRYCSNKDLEAEVWGADLDSVRRFLRWTKEHEMAETAQLICRLLSSPENDLRLKGMVRRTRMDWIARFLFHAKQDVLMEQAYDRVSAILENMPHRILREMLLETPVSFIVLFIITSEKLRLRALVRIFAVLCDKSIQRRLVKKMLTSPLGDVASLLQLIEKNAPAEFLPVVSALRHPENVSRLQAQALVTPLEHIPAFLRLMIRVKEEAVVQAVAEVLARSENQPKLRYLATQASLYSLVHFLSFVLRHHLPAGIFDTASGDLREPSCWPAMFEKHKTTPAFHFKGTLEFTAQHFPAFHAALSAELKRRDG